MFWYLDNDYVIRFLVIMMIKGCWDGTSGLVHQVCWSYWGRADFCFCRYSWSCSSPCSTPRFSSACCSLYRFDYSHMLACVWQRPASFDRSRQNTRVPLSNCQFSNVVTVCYFHCFDWQRGLLSLRVAVRLYVRWRSWPNGNCLSGTFDCFSLLYLSFGGQVKISTDARLL